MDLNIRSVQIVSKKIFISKFESDQNNQISKSSRSVIVVNHLIVFRLNHYSGREYEWSEFPDDYWSAVQS